MRWRGSPTWTSWTTCPWRITGMVRRRVGPCRGRSTVSKALCPPAANRRASGDRGSASSWGRGERSPGWPSGSENWKSLSEISGPSSSRTHCSIGPGPTSGAGGAAPWTAWATARSEASTSCQSRLRRSEYERPPATARMTSRTSEYQMVRRLLMDRGRISRRPSACSWPSVVGLQRVAGSSHGAEQGVFPFPVDLAPQIAHVDVNHVALGIEVESPHVLGDHGTGQDAPGIAHEVLEQRVLPRGEGNPPLAPAHGAARGIEEEIAHAQHGPPGLAAAAQERAHPGQELLEGEGLGEVVVRAHVESGHLVGHAVPRGEDEHGGGDPAPAHGAQDGEAVAPGQHHVEDDQIVGRAGRDEVERGLAVARHLDGVALLLQALPDETGHLSLVLGHQDAHVAALSLAHWPLAISRRQS